jgi:serine/threonine-protein kinase
MRRLIKYPLYVLSFILISAASAYITLLILSAGLTVIVPDLTGKSLQDADEILEEHGLYLKVEAEAYDRSIPAGYILSQDIPVGSRIKRREGEIKVVASKGPEARLIPSVVGKDINEVEKLLVKKGLDVSKVINVHSNKTDTGKVIAQKPASEEWTGEPIILVVSKGPYDVTYYCPFFQGMIKKDALMLVRELGLKVKLTEPAGSIGIVTGQRPKPGTPIKPGSTVYLHFGREEK